MSSDRSANTSAPTTATTGNAYREAVGHELRSPLTVIRTALGTLTDDLEHADITPEAVHMLEIALRNTRRLEEAVDRHLRELEQAELQAAAPDSHLP